MPKSIDTPLAVLKTMRNRSTKILVLVTFAGFLSCITMDGSLATGWGDGPFSWHQGQGPKTIATESDSVCVLTEVQGKFRGGGEYVRVEVGSDGYWRLEGHSMQEGVAATAYCFAKSAFLANGSARWVSPEFVVNDKTSGCNGNSVQTWWGDAATMLSGVSGEFRGGGERAYINQSPTAFTGSAVFAEACQDYLQARAYSFFAGQPQSGQVAKFWEGEYNVHFNANEQVDNLAREVKMAPFGDEMCYLTHVSGQFDGGAERVFIYHKPSGGVEHWFLRVETGWGNNGTKFVNGKARCYKRDQRIP
jgi:hypothetical protein